MGNCYIRHNYAAHTATLTRHMASSTEHKSSTYTVQQPMHQFMRIGVCRYYNILSSVHRQTPLTWAVDWGRRQVGQWYEISTSIPEHNVQWVSVFSNDTMHGNTT